MPGSHSNQPALERSERPERKKGGVPGVAPRQMEDRLRRCVAAADVAVDYFFATFFADAAFGAARVTLEAILWPLSSM